MTEPQMSIVSKLHPTGDALLSSRARPGATVLRIFVAAAACALGVILSASYAGTPLSVSLRAAMKGAPRIDQAIPLYRSDRLIRQDFGGPILLVVGDANQFSSYYAEILRNEGFNEFSIIDVARLTTGMLGSYNVAILGDISLTARQAGTLASWVRNGGNLIAMRPGPPLVNLLQVQTTGETLRNAYLRINTQTAPGHRLVKTSIQFHGDADLYRSADGVNIATLYRDDINSSGFPAILLKTFGAGQVAIFAYDLARSVVYTRQGNPAWSGMERDGISPVRPDDLFYGGATDDIHPDWVDMSKVGIPQADEQQRLLANLILLMSARKGPLPRFWYFPRELKAVVIMTGDDHGHGGTIGRFQQFKAESPSHCSLDDWQCVRGTSNIFLGSITEEEADAAVREGFEIGLHIFTGCQNWPTEVTVQGDGQSSRHMSTIEANSLYAAQLDAFLALYPNLPAPTTNRTDCVAWGDFDSQPQVELAHGIRLDTNYYYWPSAWIKNRPGMFTGSGMPMRFAKMDGSLVDVYQAPTQMTDESGQSYPYTIDTLLDDALGPAEYYGAFTANMHNDYPQSKAADEIVASAQSRGVPVITAQQMLHWLDGRNASAFLDLVWTAPELHFRIATGAGSKGLVALLPMKSDNLTIQRLEVDGSPVSFHSVDFAGLEYAAFPAIQGKYLATY